MQNSPGVSLYHSCVLLLVSLLNLCKLSETISYLNSNSSMIGPVVSADSKGCEQEVAREVLSQTEGGL